MNQCEVMLDVAEHTHDPLRRATMLLSLSVHIKKDIPNLFSYAPITRARLRSLLRGCYSLCARTEYDIGVVCEDMLRFYRDEMECASDAYAQWSDKAERIQTRHVGSVEHFGAVQKRLAKYGDVVSLALDAMPVRELRQRIKEFL